MARSAKQFQNIVKKLEQSVKEAINKAALIDVGVFATDLIVKRTRLGYGVKEAYGSKEKLAKLSPNYVKSRKMFDGLHSLTRPNKSNLTRTSQMLDSIASKVKANVIEIKPTGTRDDGKRNSDIARYNAEGSKGKKGKKGRPKRVFLNISQLEFKQIVRFYRKTFGDLLRKRKVL